MNSNGMHVGVIEDNAATMSQSEDDYIGGIAKE
jgi:hypothetical protein